jgi:hypothetical protein
MAMATVMKYIPSFSCCPIYLFFYFNALEYDRLQKDNPVNANRLAGQL